MIELPTSICRAKLWHYVCAKINYVIHSAHVFAVIEILIEEMVKDLMEDKEIRIYNFGIIKLKRMPDRNHYDFIKKDFTITPGHRILRFVIFDKIKRKLCKLLDVDKTLASPQPKDE